MVVVQNLYRLIIICLACCNSLQGQADLNWEILGETVFESKLDSASGLNFYFPNFGQKLKTLQDKEVIIQGYILPIDPQQNYYILSKFPMAMCFFCGKAGPETILELQLDPDNKRAYKMDEVVSFIGTFKLNESDIEHCNFILENAREVW